MTKQSDGTETEVEPVSYYTVCVYCGDNLDPGEKCECPGAVKDRLDRTGYDRPEEPADETKRSA